MIIDIHTHTFPDAIAEKALVSLEHNSHTMPFLSGTAGSLSASCERSGIDLAVVQPVATSPNQVESINRKAAEQNRHTEETHLLSFGCMHPQYADPEKELAQLAELGIKGIKLHPVYQKTDADDPAFLHILRAAAENGLLVLFHSGIDVGFLDRDECSVEKIARAIDAVPEGRYILAHMGGWRQWKEGANLFAGRPNVWIDTSFSLGDMTDLGDGFYMTHSLKRLTEEQFLGILSDYGSEHVLFGTDSPWEDQASEIARIRALPIPEEGKTAILGGNAARLLGLE